MKFGKFLTAAYLVVCGFIGFIGVNAHAAEDPVSPTHQASQTSQIPYKHDSNSVESDLPRMALSLTACLLLLAGGVYLIRRHFGVTLETGRSKKMLRVVESHRLNPRSSLYVVEFSGQYHLLAHSEQGIRRLASAPTISALPPEQHE